MSNEKAHYKNRIHNESQLDKQLQHINTNHTNSHTTNHKYEHLKTKIKNNRRHIRWKLYMKTNMRHLRVIKKHINEFNQTWIRNKIKPPINLTCNQPQPL